MLEQLCHAFGLTLAQFFREEEEPQLLTREETALLERYRALPPDKRQALLCLLGIEKSDS